MRSPGRVFWPLALTLVLADCSSKRAIEEAAPLVGVPRPVIDDVLQFTLAYNKGAAFSTHFGPYQRWVLIAFTLVALGVVARSYSQMGRLGWVGVAGLALVAGGAVGNLLDRIASDRGVVDFIDVGIGASRFYLFNLADAGVSVGAVLLAWALWRFDGELRLKSNGVT
ncbi:MAG: signal peptidase II [bacterium]